MGEIRRGKLVEMPKEFAFSDILTKLFIRNEEKRRTRTFFAGLILHHSADSVKKNFGADIHTTSAPKFDNGDIQL